MGKGGKRTPYDIMVFSEVVSEDESGARQRRLLDVNHSKSVEDNADIFVVSTEIAAAAEDVYALVDWADERNSKRQLGDTVLALDGEGRRFRLVIDFMPEVHFDYEVLRAEKPSTYEYECLITPPQGHLGRTLETYAIDVLAADQCAATITVRAYFDAGLSADQQEQVVHMMTVGAHNGLAKIKAYAEYGVGTLEAFENLELMPL